MLHNTRAGLFPGSDAQYAAEGGYKSQTTRGIIPPPPAAPSVTDPAIPYAYVVTAHRPSAVVSSLSARFTSAEESNLVVNKGTRVEVHKYTRDGLVGITDMPIYGRIVSLKKFRPRGSLQDHLFVLTESHKYFTMRWDAERAVAVTMLTGSSDERLAVVCEAGGVAVVHPTGNLVMLHEYDSILRVLQLEADGAKLKSQFVVRIEDTMVVDMALVEGDNGAHLLVVLSIDGQNHLSTIRAYTLDLGEKDLILAWDDIHVTPGASHLIPVSPGLGGGVILVAERVLDYRTPSGRSSTVTVAPPTAFVCWAAVEDAPKTFLLGDVQGALYKLSLDDGSRPLSMTIERVGVTSPASSITYMDSGLCFIGSHGANSQLVRLEAPSKGPPKLQIEQEFSNMAPICDFMIADLDNMGQGQLVACCNNGSHGSLRLVRNGIGISEQASIDLEGIRGVWSLKQHITDVHERYLVITFVESTHVLAMNTSEELDEAVLPGFVTDRMTVFCGMLLEHCAVQVMQQEVRLLDLQAGKLIDTWSCPHSIAKVASTGKEHVLVSTGQGNMSLLQASSSSLTVVKEHALNVEVACMHIVEVPGNESCHVAAVGTWTSKVLLLNVQDMTVLHTTDLDAGCIPRSALFLKAAKGMLLLVGMGDGQLAHWRVVMEEGVRLASKKQVTLGLKPVSLSAFQMNDVLYVFAATDRPAVVYERGGKLLYNPVNESNVTHLCAFSSEAFPDALAFAKDNNLTVAFIDAIQKLHIRTVPLGEMPQRMCHLAKAGVFAVATMSPHTEGCALRFMSQTTWESIAAFNFEMNELPTALCTTANPNEPDCELVLAGSAYLVEGEAEPSRGRLVVLQLVHGDGSQPEARFLGALVVTGSPNKIKLLQLPDAPTKVLVLINNSVCVFDLLLKDTDKPLQLECVVAARVMALHVDVFGTSIFVGDLMHCVSQYLYQPEKKCIEHVATHYEGQWMTGVCAIKQDYFLGVDHDYNMCVYRFNAEAAEDHRRAILDMVVRFNLGNHITCVRPGSLVMQLQDSELANCQTFVMASRSGMISLCIILPPARYSQLLVLQKAMEEHTQSVGNLSHSEYRAFNLDQNPKKAAPALNCLDGDLIEHVLELPRDELDAVMRSVPDFDSSKLDELLKVVEDLQRLH